MFFYLLISVSCQSEMVEQEPLISASEPVRIGWQTTWATQGQLAVLMRQQSWLQDLNFDPEFVGFSYGAPLNEGALAGEVDVLFTADQPALVLCSKNQNWQAIGRLMYNRVGTLVPKSSSIIDAKELHSSSVAIPIGAAAHRETLNAINPPDLSSLQIYNMGVQEIATLVASGDSNGKWGEIDAVSAWDPVLAELELSHHAKSVDYGKVTSLVMMSSDYIEKHPGADQRFMQALDSAYRYYQLNPSTADSAFIEHSELSTRPEALTLAASIEPNLVEGAIIRTWLTKADQEALQGAANFMQSVKILKQPLDVETCTRKIATEKR